MALRKWFRSHPLAVSLATIGCLTLAAVLLLRSNQNHEVTHAYYYDLDTGQIFSAPLGSTPILTPSGKPRGVVAMVFGCGSCAPSQRLLGWLQTSQPQTSMQRVSDTRTDESEPQIQWIAKPPDPSEVPVWFNAESPQALAIIKQARQRCDDMILCTPHS